MSGVFDRLVGQDSVVATMTAAAQAAREVALSSGTVADLAGSAMTHAWLFTGPPGSGRSVAARALAAALQCDDLDQPGCGRCRACTTVLAGTHADVRAIAPDGLSIAVKQMREVVADASRRPSVGRWQVVLIEDADRLTEQAGNALLKMVEEPPDQTIILLCAPSVDPEDISVTLRSRCRHVPLVTPSATAIAAVLERDGIDGERAAWAAGVSGGHVGRAKRLATDPDAQAQRKQALALARAATSDAVYGAVEKLYKDAATAANDANAEINERETEELKTALGAGGTGRGTAGVMRGSAGQIKDLEKRQKARGTRAVRDTLDRALMDLASLFRDALVQGTGASVTLMHPDEADQTRRLAGFASPERLLQCVEAILACREAIDQNVKPVVALDAMAAGVSSALRRSGR
ncbi:DNA polymerase III subunit delta' [Tsukamurella sp. 8F]|uniref:DNA polymerase III subunit delta' n=1 Tax=unclassified Tsukamurella TaxID=2633480 RepID=UPI0023B9556E|nr:MULTISPECIES: DNA polymerase III subunit delta' [unclassified Tsukamurella]MDF0529569.1 DNA polymerase III subunit delta' [Tsukamurella sp. 8J]MDF0585743.1 DNA polymerase III subunit delta' [Tsukamurella sp. 8F]